MNYNMEGVEQIKTQIAETVEQANELLEKAAAATGEEAKELSAQAREKLAKVRQTIAEVHAHCPAKIVARDVDTCVHENPWKAVGITAVAALVLGVLIARK